MYYHISVFVTCNHVPKYNDADVGPTLNAFISEYGMPQNFTFDRSWVSVVQNTQYISNIQRHRMYYHVSHLRYSNEKLADGGIHNIK